MRRIGVLGGSFNPPHLGHLVISTWVLNEFQLDKILFVPSYIRPIGSEKVDVPFVHRAEMTRLAIKNEPRFELSLIEGERQKVTYSVELLEILHKKYKGAEFFFLIGSDCITEIERWKRWQDLWKLSEVIVFRRLNFDPIKLEKKVHRELKLSSAPIIELSSSVIRNRIKNRLPVKFMIPAQVENYIRKNNLYL